MPTWPPGRARVTVAARVDRYGHVRVVTQVRSRGEWIEVPRAAGEGPAGPVRRVAESVNRGTGPEDVARHVRRRGEEAWLPRVSTGPAAGAHSTVTWLAHRQVDVHDVDVVVQVGHIARAGRRYRENDQLDRHDSRCPRCTLGRVHRCTRLPCCRSRSPDGVSDTSTGMVNSCAPGAGSESAGVGEGQRLPTVRLRRQRVAPSGWQCRGSVER